MPLYIFKQVIKTLFQLPTPILLWVISCVSICSQEKYTQYKQKLSKTLLLIVCASVSNDTSDRYQALCAFVSTSLEAKHAP